MYHSLAIFSVDGATTKDLVRSCRLNKVLPTDEDHNFHSVNQLDALSQWQPEIVALSVGGNNYREALQGTLLSLIDRKNLLLRHTPENIKQEIAEEFSKIKGKLLKKY